MAIPIIDNLHYTGRKPDFDRQSYNNISDFLTVKDTRMPDMYLVYCLEDRSVYLYDKSIGRSDITGKFRKFQPGNNIQVTEMPIPTEDFLNKVVQYIGFNTQTYTKGYFYHCTLKSVEINTVDDFRDFIRKFGTVNSNGDLSYIYNNVQYFIHDDVLYSGTDIDSGDLVADSDLGFTIQDYVWDYLEVSKPKDPAIISSEDIDSLFSAD